MCHTLSETYPERYIMIPAQVIGLNLLLTPVEIGGVIRCGLLKGPVVTILRFRGARHTAAVSGSRIYVHHSDILGAWPYF
jgi:hypothetical protein